MKKLKAADYRRYLCDSCGEMAIALFYDASIQDLSPHACGGTWHLQDNIHGEFYSDEAELAKLLSQLYYYANFCKENETSDSPAYIMFAMQVVNQQSLGNYLLAKNNCLINYEEMIFSISLETELLENPKSSEYQLINYWQTFIKDFEEKFKVRIDKNPDRDPYQIEGLGAGGGGGKASEN